MGESEKDAAATCTGTLLGIGRKLVDAFAVRMLWNEIAREPRDTTMLEGID